MSEKSLPPLGGYWTEMQTQPKSTSVGTSALGMGEDKFNKNCHEMATEKDKNSSVVERFSHLAQGWGSQLP